MGLQVNQVHDYIVNDTVPLIPGNAILQIGAQRTALLGGRAESIDPSTGYNLIT